MKKLFLLFCFISFACSSSDDSNEDCFIYRASIEQECANFDTSSTHIITKETRDFLVDQMDGMDPCVWVMFEDVDGNNQSGYLRSATGASCSN